MWHLGFLTLCTDFSKEFVSLWKIIVKEIIAKKYVKTGGYFCLLCGCANSSINPFLYYFRNKEIRLGMQLFLNRRLFFNKVGSDKLKIESTQHETSDTRFVLNTKVQHINVLESTNIS